MRTRFIASREAHAAEGYKKAITHAAAHDTTVTRCYSGKPMRVIRNAYVDDWARRPEEIRRFPEQMALAAREGALTLVGTDVSRSIDVDRACMPCGQGAGGIQDVPSCAEIVARICEDAERTIARLAAGVGR